MYRLTGQSCKEPATTKRTDAPTHPPFPELGWKLVVEHPPRPAFLGVYVVRVKILTSAQEFT